MGSGQREAPPHTGHCGTWALEVTEPSSLPGPDSPVLRALCIAGRAGWKVCAFVSWVKVCLSLRTSLWDLNFEFWSKSHSVKSRQMPWALVWQALPAQPCPWPVARNPQRSLSL